MAMELDFWMPDGLQGEFCEKTVRVQAWEILGAVESWRNERHCMITLRHTSRQRGSWVIWVRPGYAQGTQPQVGRES